MEKKESGGGVRRYSSFVDHGKISKGVAFAQLGQSQNKEHAEGTTKYVRLQENWGCFEKQSREEAEYAKSPRGGNKHYLTEPGAMYGYSLGEEKKHYRRCASGSRAPATSNPKVGLGWFDIKGTRVQRKWLNRGEGRSRGLNDVAQGFLEEINRKNG